MLWNSILIVTVSAFRVPVTLREADGVSSAVTLRGHFGYPLDTVGPVSIGVSIMNEDALLVVASDINGAVRMNQTIELMDTDSGLHNISIPRAYAITSNRGGYTSRIVKAEVGIGAISSIMRSLGSVDFVRDTTNNSRGFLFFAEDIHSEYCSNNSTISVRYNWENVDVYEQNLASLWQLELVDPISGNRTVTEMRGYNAATEIRIESSKIGGVRVPSDVVGFVRGRIEESTRVDAISERGASTISFDECTRVLPLLASISLNLYNFSGDYVGNMIFTPEDYTYNLGGDRCTLLLTPHETNGFEFDPLRLDGINTRFTSTHVSFCDAL
jgi:hypothetical protein